MAPWAARYNTWLLIKLTPIGVVLPPPLSFRHSHGQLWLLQAMLAAGQAARASLCLKVLLEGSLDQQKPDILVLLFLVKSGFTTGTVASLQVALGHARSASKPPCLIYIPAMIHVEARLSTPANNLTPMPCCMHVW